MSETRYPAPEATPTTLGDLLVNAGRIYRAHPALFIAIMLVTALPVGIAGIAAGVTIDEGSSDRVRQLVGALVQVLPVVLIYPVSAVATALALIAIVNGRRPSLGAAVGPVARRMLVMSGVLVVSTVAIFLGIVAFIAPGVFLFTIWIFAAHSSVVERLSVQDALARSMGLVKGGFFAVFGTFLVLEIITGAIITVVLLAVRSAADGLSNDAEVVVAGVTAIVATCVVKPFEMIGLALLYLDRRVRQEGEWPDLVENRLHE